MSMTEIHQKLLKHGWIKITKGVCPVYNLPGKCRLRIRRNGKEKAIVAAITDIPISSEEPIIVINEGDTYKVELNIST